MIPFRRLLADEGGQDLVEYVLLGATVGIVGVVAMNVFAGVINVVYASWVNAVWNLWEPTAPTS